jgi:hypothetical protein
MPCFSAAAASAVKFTSAVSLQRAAMASCQLFFAGVAVVDDDEESALQTGGDAIHGLLCGERCFDTFFGLGMD